MFDRIEREWGHLDILVHSIASVPKGDLQGGLLNCSSSGFSVAVDISYHSFIRMERQVEPCMGGASAPQVEDCSGPPAG